MQAEHIARVIFDYAAKIGTVTDTGQFLNVNADMARDLVGADRCTIWLVDAARQELWTTVAHGLAEGMKELRIPAGQGIVGAAISAGESVVVNDATADPRFLRVDSGGYQTRSLLVIPLRSQGGSVIGALQALNKPGGFQDDDIHLLGLAASSIASALEAQRLRHEAEAARLLQREIQIASSVQQRLLPQDPPPIAGLDYAAFCRPAKGVGGDYYDFIPMPDGGLMMTLGDVSGKGIAAAVLMASIQASIRSRAVNPPPSIATLMEEFNRAIFSFSTVDKYSTLFVARWDGEARVLTYVNAGQVRPVVVRANGDTEELATGGMPVGLLPAVSYEQGSVTLAPGDMLVACSDGVTEAMNEADEMWPEDEFLGVLKAGSSLPARTLIGNVISSIDAFAGAAEQSDDITVLVLRLVS